MSDQIEDFETIDDEDENTVSAPTAEDGLTAFADEVVGSVDPSQYITFTTMGGQSRYVATTQPMRLMDAFATTGLSLTGAFKFFLNGAEVKMDDTIPAGSTVSILGQAVKGGGVH